MHVRSGKQSRDSRSKRTTMSLTNIRNLLFEDSGDSESESSDEEYVADDGPAARTDGQHEISFFGRKKDRDTTGCKGAQTV